MDDSDIKVQLSTKDDEVRQTLKESDRTAKPQYKGVSISARHRLKSVVNLSDYDDINDSVFPMPVRPKFNSIVS